MIFVIGAIVVLKSGSGVFEFGLGKRLYGQEIWQYSPYKVDVWFATDESPELGPLFQQRLARSIVWRSEQVDLSGWVVKAIPVASNADADETDVAASQSLSIGLNNQLRANMLHGLERFVPTEDASLEQVTANLDKVFLVAVKKIGLGLFQVEVREFDCRTLIWGNTHLGQCHQTVEIPGLVYRLITSAFSPLARVEAVEGKIATLRLKGAGLSLILGENGKMQPNRNSPIWPRELDVFVPLVRRVDQSGTVKDGGVTVIDWTFLTTQSNEGVIVKCDIHSAMRTPLGGRSSRRTEKLALAVRPAGPATALTLTSRDEKPRPLAGLRIYSVDLAQDDSELIGKTDWNGQLAIEANESPLRILYVLSGQRRLARLPVVPGYYDTLTAQMYDDEMRLRAEGIIRRMQNDLMDLVAQREIMAMRIRTAIGKKDMEEAKALFDEFSAFESRADYETKLDSQERLCQSKDEREQEKIDIMFNDLRKNVMLHLTKKLGDSLEKELDINHEVSGS